MEHNKIFETMARQGKTGKDLAVYLNVTQQTVTNWKIGVSESYKKRLPEIAVFLNTTVEELTGISLPAEETNSLTQHEINLIQAYRANTKMQEAVDTLLGLDKTAVPGKNTGNINAYTPIIGKMPTGPRIAAYGGGCTSLDAPKEFDDVEIDEILSKIKKFKK